MPVVLWTRLRESDAMTASSREKLLKALIEIGQELVSTTDLDVLLERILAASREVFGFENAIIRLLDADAQQLTTVAAYGYPEEVTRPPLRIGQGVMGRVAQSGEPLLVDDLRAEPAYVPGIVGARSELAVPLLIRDRVIGVFNVESPRPKAFGRDDIGPLAMLAGQAAIAIENARLYESLRSVSERYRKLHHLTDLILNSASIGIYTVDVRFTITSWNRRMAELSGVGADEALGRNLFTLFPALDDEGFAARIRAVLKSGEPDRLQLTHRNLRGETRIQKRWVSPLKDEGVTSGAVVLVEDITEFRQLLEQTIQAEKLAEIGRLSAALAHEVNNPLAVIGYAAQLMQRDDPLSPFQLEMAERISGEAERLKALAGSLLSFSRANGSDRRICNVNEIVRDVLRLLRFELARKGVVLEEYYGDVPPVQADPNRLKQVFINLIMNAAQVLERGGVLTISSAIPHPGAVAISFIDNGPGIADDIREQIFDPFFSTKPSGEGTGLGLYICRQIVSEHDGHLTVESRLGSGSNFSVVLPSC